jgi:hypothetical protein
MRVPAKGERLVAASGEVWIVLRTHVARDDPAFFALDVIRQQDVAQTSRAVNLTWDEFVEFCRREGIPWPGS